MIIKTPGIGIVHPVSDSRRPLKGRVGIVLNMTEASEEVSVVRGPRAGVRLVAPFDIISEVLIGSGAYGPDEGFAELPSVTSSELRAQIYKVLNGEGGPDEHVPDPRDPSYAWGSWVILDYLSCDIPFVVEVLDHPSSSPNIHPVRDEETDGTRGAAGDEDVAGAADAHSEDDKVQGEDVGAEAEETTADSRERFAMRFDASVPSRVPDPPMSITALTVNDESISWAWDQSYIDGWKMGAKAAYAEGQSRPPTSAEKLSALSPDVENEETLTTKQEALRSGWESGQQWGAEERKTNPPPPGAKKVGTPSAPQSYFRNEADDADGDNESASASSLRDGVWSTGGHRGVAKRDGSFIIDSRAAGKVRVQGSDQGIRLTASGVTIDIGEGGKTIRLGGQTCRAVLGDAMLLAFNNHTHTVSGSTPDTPMSPSEVLSDTVVLG